MFLDLSEWGMMGWDNKNDICSEVRSAIARYFSPAQGAPNHMFLLMDTSASFKSYQLTEDFNFVSLVKC